MGTPTIGWKLFKLRKNGTLGSLFINASAVLPVGEWMDAENCHEKKGYKYRPFWHCCYQCVAPHLKERLASGEQRVWRQVAMQGVFNMDRPESQGGAWCLAGRIKILQETM
jgi:hypothetical protein